MIKELVTIRNIVFVLIGIVLVVISSLYYIKKNATPQQQNVPGFWTKARVTAGMLKEKEEAYKKLLSLGYLQGYDTAPEKENVTIFEKALAYDGLNFYLSGHAPEALLMDMQGTVLHSWRYKNADDIWTELGTDGRDFAYFWRRAYPFENGDVLAIYNEIALIKLDKDSNLLWEYKASKRPHHALDVAEDGTIYLVTNEKKKLQSLRIEDQPEVIVDYITVLSPEGSVIRHVPLFDLLERSKYRSMINYELLFKVENGDIMHANSIKIFDGRFEYLSPIFAKGNVMVSLLRYHTIFIIDMAAEEVIWALRGMWRYQHEPHLLENGNMLIFNNIYTFDSSQVLEFDPFTQKITWEYRGTDDQPFFSRTCGSNQRLPNGNTLITETDFGRAFEVTHEGKIVWEFVNPHRAGENNELIASIPEMIRVEKDFFTFLDAE